MVIVTLRVHHDRGSWETVTRDRGCLSADSCREIADIVMESITLTIQNRACCRLVVGRSKTISTALRSSVGHGLQLANYPEQPPGRYIAVLATVA